MKSFKNRPSARASRLSRGARRSVHLLDLLEPRTLLSVTIAANGKSASYIDASGNPVTISFSKGTLTAGIFTTVAAGQGEQLQTIDLSGGGFDGTNITMKIKLPKGQSGIGDIGYINSVGHDLGVVSIPGDLGRIDAGDADLSTPAIKSLSAGSMGSRGTTTQDVGGTLQSNIHGSIGSFTLEGNFANATLTVAGAGASIGAIKFGGGLSGGNVDGSGSISAVGSIASLTVGGGITGGAGDQSGMVSGSSIGAVKVGGNVSGNAGDQSGEILSTSGAIASVSIGGGLIGGTGDNSGEIAAIGGIGNISIGGGITGGAGDFSGAIAATDGSIGSITIGGGITGNAGDGSGAILAHINIGAIKVSSSVTGGNGDGSAQISTQTGNIASVGIGGSLVGGNGNNSGQILVAGGISKTTISGSISTGAVPTSGCIDANGTLKTVTVGGSLNASEITAGSIGKLSINGGVSAGSSIAAVFTIGSIAVKQDIAGAPLSPVVISAGGLGGAGDLVTGKSDVAIKSLSVSGNLSFTNILAGYTTEGAPIDRHAQIGTVSVSANLTATNIVAGAENDNSTNTEFGDANDTRIAANGSSDTETPVSIIASIKVGGAVSGTDSGVNAADHFGFVAQSVGSVTIGGVKVTLNAAADTDDVAIGATGDFNVHEV